MGVADNKTYRDQYHFNYKFYDDTLEENPSINVEPKINTSIKENPYRANVEVEKNEVILNPDLSALFHAKGKTHKQGGIEVMLKPESFVFSADKQLAFTERDHKLMELKEGGNFKKEKNTPADVLKRNIDLEHYNRIMSILQDPKSDDLARKSSERMVAKYVKTLGNIAYLQEEKKQFPDGLPSFSADTAPVYNSDLKDEIDEQKQYMKYGGQINNNHLPKMQRGKNIPKLPFMWQNSMYDVPKDQWDYQWINGKLVPVGIKSQPTQASVQQPSTQQPAPPSSGTQQPASNRQAPVTGSTDGYPTWLKAWTQSNTVKGRTSPTGYVPTTYPADKKIKDDYDYWKTVAGRDFASPEDFQGFVYSSIEQNNPAAIENMWKKFGHTAKNKDEDIQNFVDNIFGVRTAELTGYRNPTNNPYVAPKGSPDPTKGTTPTVRTEAPVNNPPGPTPGQVTGAIDKGKTFPWQFTPWQKISMGNDLYKLASVKRYMPYRAQVDLTNANPYLVNPEQAINDVKGAAYQQMSSLNTLNPILRNAQASAISGSLMNQLPGIRSQYDNQNAQIKNQFSQMNTQINNQERMINSELDQKYYQQSIEGLANYDNMKNYLRDQYMNNLMGNVQDNQQLSYMMATMDNPAYGYNFKTGDFYRNPKDIRDVQGGIGGESIEATALRLKQAGWSDQLIGDVVRSAVFQQSGRRMPAPRRAKKGGIINPYKK